MTEEIIENEGIQEEIQLSGKKKKTPKKRGPHDLNKKERILVYSTGVVCFGGLIFCLVMITLMNSIPY